MKTHLLALAFTVIGLAGLAGFIYLLVILPDGWGFLGTLLPFGVFIYALVYSDLRERKQRKQT